MVAVIVWFPLAARASTGPAGHILFTRIWAGFETIWTVAPDGSGETQIVIPGAQGHPIEPRWSPDGRKIVFVVDGNVFSALADGSQARALTSGGDSFEPAWSPDGTKIAFRKGRQIWVMNADGTAPAQLTHPFGPNPSDSEPAWSPDGTQIAFVRDHDNADGDYRVYRVAVASGDINPVSVEEVRASWPAWTPDGTGIVFAEATWYYTHTGLTRVNLNDGTTTALTSGSDDHPAFSPDGTQIAFARFNATNSAGFGTHELWAMNADGSAQARIPTDPTLYGPETPDWGIGPVLPVPPSNTTAPSVPQSELTGTQVSADPGAWSGSPTSYDYQWVRCHADGTTCVDIAENGTTAQYTPVIADVGRRLKVRVTAHNGDGASAPAESSLSGVVQAAPPPATPKQAADDLTQALDRLAQVSQALGGTGPIAQPLGLTTSGPGNPGLLGLGNLLAGATVDRLSNPADLSQLATQLTGTANLSGGRTATVAASVASAVAGQPNTVRGLDLSINVVAHPTGLPLKISSTSPALTLSSAQGTTGDLTLSTQLALRYDTATREVWLDASGAAPTVGIDATVTVKRGRRRVSACSAQSSTSTETTRCSLRRPT